jgi:hypothetical protein
VSPADTAAALQAAAQAYHARRAEAWDAYWRACDEAKVDRQRAEAVAADECDREIARIRAAEETP